MRLKRKSGRDAFWNDDGGFSTLGMAVALLVTLSLVFSAAQVYRVSSASADIQDVADACVLAAEGEVAEFMIAVRVCDAMVLSLSLTSAAMFGLGVVALCAPPAAELGIELVNLGTKVLQARNTFAERAASGLNALQEALPFLAAASAYAAASSNSGGAMAASYLGIAMLVPAEGERIEVGASKALSDAADAVSEDAESIKQASEEAEEAAKEAFSAKEKASSAIAVMRLRTACTSAPRPFRAFPRHRTRCSTRSMRGRSPLPSIARKPITRRASKTRLLSPRR